MTAEMRSAVEAKQLVPFYTRRGRVEDLFRVLKTGSQGEKWWRPPANRWLHAITLHLVTAWRIMLMTRLGRVATDLPAKVIFTQTELEVLRI